MNKLNLNPVLRVCVIKNCHNQRSWSRTEHRYIQKGGKIFFRFPKDPKKRDRWILAVMPSVRPCVIRMLYDDKVDSYICEDHFILEHDMLNYKQFAEAKCDATYVPIILKGDIVPMKNLNPNFVMYNDTNYPHLIEHDYSLTIFMLCCNDVETEKSSSNNLDRMIVNMNETSNFTNENLFDANLTEKIKSEPQYVADYFECEDYHFAGGSQSNKTDESETISLKSLEIIQCDFCTLEFCYKTDLLQHIQAKHLDIGLDQFYCSHCSSCFTNESTFVDHVRVAHGAVRECSTSGSDTNLKSEKNLLNNDFSKVTKPIRNAYDTDSENITSEVSKYIIGTSQDQYTESKEVPISKYEIDTSQECQTADNNVPKHRFPQSYIDHTEIYREYRHFRKRSEPNKAVFKTCFIPTCENDNAAYPEKIFFKVPRKCKRWFMAANKEFPTDNSTVFFCCEDHFDLKGDATLHGQELILKRNVLPHKFNAFYKNVACKQTKRKGEQRMLRKRKNGQLKRHSKANQDVSAGESSTSGSPKSFVRYNRNESKSQDREADDSGNSQSFKTQEKNTIEYSSPLKGNNPNWNDSPPTPAKETKRIDSPQPIKKAFDLDQFEKHEQHFKNLLDGMARMRKKERADQIETHDDSISLVASHKQKYKHALVLKEVVIKLDRRLSDIVQLKSGDVNIYGTRPSRKSFDLQEFEQHELNCENILNHTEEEDVFEDNALLRPLKIIKEEVINDEIKCLKCPELIPGGHVLCDKCNYEQLNNAVKIDDADYVCETSNDAYRDEQCDEKESDASIKIKSKLTNRLKADIPKTSQKETNKLKTDIPKTSQKETNKLKTDIPKTSQTGTNKLKTNIPKTSQKETNKLKTDIPKTSQKETNKLKTDIPKTSQKETNKLKTDIPKTSQKETNKLKTDIPKTSQKATNKLKTAIPKTSQKGYKTKRRICVVCQKEFHHYRGWYDHMKAKHGADKLYSCDVCGVQFAFKKSLMKHTKNKHLHSDPVTCSVCVKEFKNYKCLRRHTKNCRADTRSVECNICHSVLKNSKCLKSHLQRVHHVVCNSFENCGKVYNNQSKLNTHTKRLHLDTAKKCNYCPLLFYSTEYLEQHMKDCITHKIHFEIKVESADSDGEDWCIK